MSGDRLLFQIGFNKCATSAFFTLFRSSGVRAVHGNGRFWRSRGERALLDRNLQIEIDRNVRQGQPALRGFEEFEAFFDMEYVSRGKRIENFRHFRSFAREYPHALFLLNTRDKVDWLQSRLRHGDGKYLKTNKKHLGLGRTGVLRAWSDDFDRHHEEVLEFFAGEEDRLIVFDVDHTPIENLLDFVGPDWGIDPAYWKKVRVTDTVAAKLGWKDLNQAANPILELGAQPALASGI